jgi:hypothetical protein
MSASEAGRRYLAALAAENDDDRSAETFDTDRNGAATDDTDLLADMFTGDWLDAQRFPPLSYAVDGLVPEGFGLLVGSPKKGKSWLAYDIALAVATGGKALGRIDVQARPVLYMALEDGKRRLQDRGRYLMFDQPIPANLRYLTVTTPGVVALGQIAEFLRRYPDGLVIVDTLGKAKSGRPPGVDPYQYDYGVGNQLKALADASPGSTVLVVHHARKMASADFVDMVSGTHGIAGSADFVMVLARQRGAGEATLSVTGRDIEDGEYALTFDSGRWELAGLTLADAAAIAREQSEQGNLGDLTQKILRFVNGRPQTTPADVAAALGIDSKAASKYLTRLYDRRQVRKLGWGVYTPGESVESVVIPGQDTETNSPPVSKVSYSEPRQPNEFDTFDSGG